MKKILLFCLVLMMASCETIQYDGEVRLAIKGQVVDKNNNPIPDKPIEIVAYREESSAYDLISYGKTDSFGNFLMIIPAPKGLDDLVEVVINENDLQYQKKKYRSIKRKDFNDYQLQLPSTVLYSNSDLTILKIQIQQNTPDINISNIRLTSGLLADNNVEFNPIPLDYIPYEYYFQLVKNQNVTVSYTLTDYRQSPAIDTQHSESITIGSNNVLHLINY